MFGNQYTIRRLHGTLVYMSYFHGLILGLVQGLTEFIPVSSSGHLILVRQFFGGASAGDLSVDAVLQLATVLAVLVYFWKDLWRLFVSFLRLLGKKEVVPQDKTLLYSIIIGTIPAVIFGLLLETKMETIFRNAHLVAYALIAGSALMYFAEKYARQNVSLTTKKGFVVGLFQCLALVPGVSRSGSTISGGLFQGLTRSEATRFSFLLSFPIIFGSGMKKLLELAKSGALHTLGFPLALSFITAFVVGLISIHYLIKYLKTHSLNVFVVYRILLAILIIIVL